MQTLEDVLTDNKKLSEDLTRATADNAKLSTELADARTKLDQTSTTAKLHGTKLDELSSALKASDERSKKLETDLAALSSKETNVDKMIAAELSKRGIAPLAVAVHAPRVELSANDPQTLFHEFAMVRATNDGMAVARFMRLNAEKIKALGKMDYLAAMNAGPTGGTGKGTGTGAGGGGGGGEGVSPLGAAGGWTNTIPAALQRQVFMDKVMRAFKYRTLPLKAFCIRFNNVPLEGTDKLDVPYYPLSTNASVDFAVATGYVFTGSYAVDFREVTVNKRKYAPMTWSSQDLRRQPMLNPEQIAQMIGEKLAQDVMTDIFSVITAANYGAPPTTLTGIAASALNWSLTMDMKNACDVAMWPAEPRTLVLDSTYANYLWRDNTAATAYSYGEPGGVANGIRDRIAGFEIVSVPVLPNNGATEKLCGFAAYPTAAIIAFSPIRPTPEVEQLLTSYQVTTDEDSGLTLEYRRGADTKGDYTFQTIECNYGYNYGQKEALIRITTP